MSEASLLKTNFSSIAERILYSIIIAFSKRNHIANDKVSIQAQEQLHDLMCGILTSMYNNPTVLKIPIDDSDDAFSPHECLNQYPERTKRFKSVYEIITSFYMFLYTSGLNGQVIDGKLEVESSKIKPKIKPIYLEYLTTFGFEIEKRQTQLVFSYPANKNILDAWKLLAETSVEYGKLTPYTSGTLFNFVACVFNGDYSYWLDKSNDLLGFEPGFLKSVFDIYRSKEYQITIYGELSGNAFAMHCMSKKEVSGISFEYLSRQHPAFLVRPLNFIGVKSLLEQFDELDNDVKELLVNTCKKCTGCLLCTKGKNIKIHAQKVNIKDKTINLCPSYPDMYWFNQEITDNVVSTIIKFNQLQEVNGKDWHK